MGVKMSESYYFHSYDFFSTKPFLNIIGDSVHKSYFLAFWISILFFSSALCYCACTAELHVLSSRGICRPLVVHPYNMFVRSPQANFVENCLSSVHHISTTCFFFFVFFFPKFKVWICTLLCATAQQSYCHHAGVCRPSAHKTTRFIRNHQAN